MKVSLCVERRTLVAHFGKEREARTIAVEIKKVYVCSDLNLDSDPGLTKLVELLEENDFQILNLSNRSENPNNALPEEDIETEGVGQIIEQCSIVVVYISPETKDSEAVDWEIEYAHRNSKRIVSVWEYEGSGCELPAALNAYSDALVGWKDNRIMDAINGDINETQNPDGTRCRETELERYDCGKKPE